MERVLGIDFGTQRIGLALSYGTLAEPYGIIDNDAGTFELLAHICREHSVNQLVVGLSERSMAEKTKKFVAELTKYTSLPVEYIDETLSTKEVRALLSNKNSHSKKRRHVDHLVAARLLQEWLDAQLPSTII